MKYVTFYDGDRKRPGFIDGDCVAVIACESLVEYIALPPHAREQHHTIERLPLADVRLAAPVRPHKNVFCVGRNYLEHAKEGARALGRELKLPEVPTFFSKAPTAIADPGANLHFDATLSTQYDWEAELAVVIGKRVKNATESNALDAVFGYTCLNDITARDLQRAHLQWLKGKSLDDSCPIGPWIVDKEETGDPQRLQISLRVNGVKKQEANTGQMIFRISRLIAELSRGLTLEPGDVIATGTPDGVGFARTPPEFFKHGDVVEISIQKIGTLRNSVFIS
ncbi:MAG TPA: fumarylacetoacetate hydrolase family protein [Candidatus Baltobacteraceae bacterium]|nr:fumarylacetoacetate hydrolase family protein [Candidatus Baltobacteraceae bacterium]